MSDRNKEEEENKRQDTLRKLDETMLVFAKEREKLNQMSVQRIALGKPLTDGALLEQNEVCSNISLDIMELQEVLDEIEDEIEDGEFD
ncbi:MAG: hypothetical protein VB082_10935 [Christensenella sp.]|nr:hypothetical protein [Christensenella sp.]